MIDTREKITQGSNVKCQEQKGREGKELDDFTPISPEACCNCLNKPFNLSSLPGAEANTSRGLCKAS